MSTTAINGIKTGIIELQQFDIRTLFRNSVIVFVGRRRTGKSNAMLNIAYYFRWFPYFLCMSSTDALNGDWSYRMPYSFIHSEWDGEKIKKLVASRIRLKWMNKNNPNFKLEPIMIILEDLMYDSTAVMNDKWFKYLLNNGRHVEICIMVTVQYIYQMSRVCRTNVDFLFACAEKNEGNRKRLWQEFGGSLEWPQFDTIFKRITTNFGIMVFNVNAVDYDVSKSIFRWKAYKMERTDHWRLGSDAYWKKHEDYLKLYGDKLVPFADMDADEDFHNPSKRGRKHKLSERERQELNVEVGPIKPLFDSDANADADLQIDDEGNVIGGSDAEMARFIIPSGKQRKRDPVMVKFV